MIQVLSKKTFQFRNPNAAMLNRDAKLGDNDQVNLTTKYDEAFFIVQPGNVQTAPDWIKTDPIFDWATKDGDLLEIPMQPSSPGTGPGNPLIAQAQQQQADDARKAQQDKVDADLAATKAALAGMSKQELVDHAADVHGLALSPSLKKDDIIANIVDAQAKKDADVSKEAGS